ncbi:MAG: hypothetical protein IT176_11960 [Acidobacteria bacterium]|nr:hypothetical protein [Acidobacteriota bacterium]
MPKTPKPARRSPRRSPRPVTRADLVRLERQLHGCSEDVARLKLEIEINIRRMGAMQTAIDRLRTRQT